MKLKLIKRIFKKFKIILNINYLKNQISLKTKLKSILNQSGVLDALFAEEYINDLLEIFFYDLFNILYLPKKNLLLNQSIEIEIKKEMLINDKIKLYSEFLWYSFYFEDIVDNIRDMTNYYYFGFKEKFKKNKINLNSKYNYIKNLPMEEKINNNDDDNEYISEFKTLNFQIPLYIYMYKKNLKNVFLIYNLITSLILKKLFLSFWKRRKKNFKKINKWLNFCQDRIFKKKILINLNKFTFFKKFDFLILYIKLFFKLALLCNFKYIFNDYLNYFDLRKSIILLFNTFFSFYRYPEFRKRKINFRKKVRKNMFLENQYI